MAGFEQREYVYGHSNETLLVAWNCLCLYIYNYTYNIYMKDMCFIYATYIVWVYIKLYGLPCWFSSKEPACNAGDTEMQVWSLGQEGPWDEEIAIHSSLAWKIPWGSQRVWHDWVTKQQKTLYITYTSYFYSCHNTSILSNSETL